MSFAEHLSFACIWASAWTDSFGPMNEFDIEAFVNGLIKQIKDEDFY